MTSTNLVSPPSSATVKKRLNPATVKKAVNALLKWKDLQNPNHSQSDDYIYLLLTLKKIPPKDRTTVPYKLPLLHPLDNPLSSDLNLLVIGDRSPKLNDPSMNKIESDNIHVIKLSKIKSEYRSFESKRKLYESYDRFFVDKRVAHLLPEVLGRVFYRKKKSKVPVPVDLGEGRDWKEQIEAARNSVFLCLGSGTCSVVRVGKGTMEKKEIVQNVIKVVDEIVEIVPKKWSGVKAFHLKFTESLALPIYGAFGGNELGVEGVSTNVEMKKEEGNDVVGRKGCLINGEDDHDDEGENIEMGKKRKETDVLMVRGKRAKEIGDAGQ